MTAQNRKRYLLVAGMVATVALLLLHYKQRDSYRCRICSSTQDVSQWRLGLWMSASVPLTPSWERVTETRFFHDFLPPNHVHDWVFAQGSPYHFFGTTWGGCAIGGGRHINELCQLYESNSRFRTFLQTKLRDSSLLKSNIIALMANPLTGEASPLEKDARELLDGFHGR
jgi:hypothetical protein